MTNPRYAAFIAAHGKQPVWAYMIFINRMKIMYTASLYNPIFDHDEFTEFIQANAEKFNMKEGKIENNQTPRR